MNAAHVCPCKLVMSGSSGTGEEKTVEQCFARVPVKGDRLVWLGEATTDPDVHVRVVDVLLLPAHKDSTFALAVVKCVPIGAPP